MLVKCLCGLLFYTGSSLCGFSFLLKSFFIRIILLWGSNLSTHIKFVMRAIYFKHVILLAQISASELAEATSRVVGGWYFQMCWKLVFYMFSSFCFCHTWVCVDLTVEYGELKMRLFDPWAPWQEHNISLPNVSQESQLEMNFLTITQSAICNLPKLTKTKFLDPHKIFFDMCSSHNACKPNVLHPLMDLINLWTHTIHVSLQSTLI